MTSDEALEALLRALIGTSVVRATMEQMLNDYMTAKHDENIRRPKAISGSMESFLNPQNHE